jgi:hypothetical protein
MEILQSMNFTWQIINRRKVHSPDLEAQWQWQYNKLLAFHEENNHCNVPRPYAKDKSLGNWVARQRQLYKQCQLREDRKECLDAIGFTWSFEKQRDKQWSEKYNELCSFQKEKGHLQVSKSNERYTRLYCWIRLQHSQEARGTLEPQRKAKLEKLGLEWKGRTKKK